MLTLACCPACQTPDPIPTPIPTNVSAADAARFETGVVSDSKYAVCRRCDLLFARRRQDERDVDAYYQAFQVLEKRDYAVYPPPKFFLDQQQHFSDWLLGELQAAGVLEDCDSVLNVRCENGIHLANLRDRHGVRNVYGLDHFDSNLHYAREDLGLEQVHFLHPAKPEPRFDRSQFDLVLANHQITHALDPLGLLKQFRKWLTPRGVLVLYNENDHHRWLRRKRLYREGAGNYHKQLLTRHSLHNLCRLAGLDCQRCTRRKRAIKWACPPDTMLVFTRAAPPQPVAALPMTIGSSTLRKIAVGRSLDFAYRASGQLGKFVRRPAA